MFHATFIWTIVGLGLGCSNDAPPPVDTPPIAEIVAPVAQQQPLSSGPLSSLLVSQAWFWRNASDDLVPGPARLEIWQQTTQGWNATRLEDADSNVFHKAFIHDGGIVTIGAEQAIMKHWTFANGSWNQDTLWQKSWAGQYNRLRDVEVGDVDGDGQDEFVIATHDAGVIAVYNPDDKTTIELDEQPDIFVHEIEIGDIDGDGTLEFFATPSDRNRANVSQRGALVMYRYNGTTYEKTIIDSFEDTHAKEILVTDLDQDGTSELFGVIEAKTGANHQVTSPVEIRQYVRQQDGTFQHTVIASIEDRMTRFLVAGDFDADGTTELVAAAMSSGLWLLKHLDNKWHVSLIDADSSGFEHTCFPADLDGDGTPELVVASDNQQELRSYRWQPDQQRFERTLIGRLADTTITWNITHGQL